MPQKMKLNLEGVKLRVSPSAMYLTKRFQPSSSTPSRFDISFSVKTRAIDLIVYTTSVSIREFFY